MLKVIILILTKMYMNTGETRWMSLRPVGVLDIENEIRGDPRAASLMPQQTSAFEACSWVPILQVDGLGQVRVNCFSKAIATWHGRESNPRPPDLESDALTTPPRRPETY
ncbi:hypothetical protein ElyMa_005244100 [Elysia marginata]|uniref:Uncharacterized protein n=1 Tax=Elysia marginata TaxID=1093978 RepID=A0AAV4K2U5_9GAST|nr:hypothetical protein ElyMa_005244100 [Elysia marginata]